MCVLMCHTGEFDVAPAHDPPHHSDQFINQIRFLFMLQQDSSAVSSHGISSRQPTSYLQRVAVGYVWKNNLKNGEIVLFPDYIPYFSRVD